MSLYTFFFFKAGNAAHVLLTLSPSTVLTTLLVVHTTPWSGFNRLLEIPELQMIC